MSFTDLLGLGALAALWVNTLLIVAHAGLQRGDLARRRDRLRGARHGRVSEGSPLAEARTVQVARSRGDGQVHFHDRGYESESFGGTLQLAGESLQVPAIGAGGAVEVWVDPRRMREAGRCVSPEDFDSLYAGACKARGAERVIRQALSAGDEIWLVPADGEGPLWLSGVDPAPWIARQRALLLAFMLGSLALLGLCSVLALWPPVYGTISTLGGALCLAFFLLVQPVAATLGERVLPLHRAVLRGRWSRPVS
jgi:hypothetical protein